MNVLLWGAGVFTAGAETDRCMAPPPVPGVNMVKLPGAAAAAAGGGKFP